MNTAVQEFRDTRLQSCQTALESPARICNIQTVHKKSYPKRRIKVILINQDLGL